MPTMQDMSGQVALVTGAGGGLGGASAVRIAERGADERVWGSMAKQTLKRRKPGFNEGYYGFRSFNALLEEGSDAGVIEQTREKVARQIRDFEGQRQAGRKSQPVEPKCPTIRLEAQVLSLVPVRRTHASGQNGGSGLDTLRLEVLR